MRRSLKLMLVPALAVGVLVGGASAASAQPFLCPVVGEGVNNADAHNGDNGVAHIAPAVGTSLLPGQNRAGTHAEPNSFNALNPDDPDAGPGANPDFSPIWPG